MRLPRGQLAASARSVTLLRLFLVASGVILATGAFILTNLLTTTLRKQALESEVESASLLASAVLAPTVVRGNGVVATPAAVRIAQTIRVPINVRSLNAWSRDGTLIFTNVAPHRIGHRLKMDDGLRRFFRIDRPFANVIDLRSDDDERATANGRSGHPRLIDTYAPIIGASGHTVGAYEVYVESDHLDGVVARGTRDLWLAVLAVFGSLYAALSLLVRSASKRMRRQTAALTSRSAELQQSYALLERSSLETIETLNATVEAKDPYTAGHSHRVHAMSLLIGRELGLSPQRLELLGTAALFHDVGKIGVPDAILTKPAALTREEFEIVKQHAARGAEIVAHISTLTGAVPAIRHHHERWDGLGYPAGLAGEAIPLEASIVGMADAWDAMTSVRPYAGALPIATALQQLRAGRGTQFRPEVVDAFLAVAEQTRIAHVTRLPVLRQVPPAEATG